MSKGKERGGMKIAEIVEQMEAFDCKCVVGTLEDTVAFKELKRYADEMDDILAHGKHTHKSGEMVGKHMDTCATCGHDIRHSIHHRLTP